MEEVAFGLRPKRGDGSAMPGPEGKVRANKGPEGGINLTSRK